MRSAMARVSPGTPLREGIDHILSSGTGALLVIGDVQHVLVLSNGGFRIESPFTPERLFELAKMDGAIVIDAAVERILFANVFLVPDPELPTSETGMRHQAAERVSRQTDALVISISQRRDVVSLYLGGEKLILDDLEVLLAKANQALQTLQRFRARLDEVSGRLMALEFEDLVTINDVAGVIRRFEMLQRVAREVGRYILELGSEGRLLRMQAEELTLGVEEDYLMLLRDYAPDDNPRRLSTLRSRLAHLPAERLLESEAIAGALGYSAGSRVTEEHVHPRGYRLLRRIPMLPATVIGRLVDRFGSLSGIVHATETQLDDVDGVGARRAKAIVDGVRRMRREVS
ncbi:MAG: DNA integrity scanning protein DisA [Coriobacteriia bacterium]|nr:DNA integrity scanning protein DisA [Coriobacteriia bacterium]